MERNRIILYASSLHEVQQIDSRELGELIKKELAWVAGKTDEPVFDDVRCDVFHHRLQEQQELRDKWANERQNRRDAAKSNEKEDKEEVVYLKEGESAVKKKKTKKEEEQYKEWLKNKAKEFSSNPTNAEAVFESVLEKSLFNYTKQVPIMVGNKGYIPDFILNDYNLIVEIDGPTHDSEEMKLYDLQRTIDLKKKGYDILRIKNADVYNGKASKILYDYIRMNYYNRRQIRKIQHQNKNKKEDI